MGHSHHNTKPLGISDFIGAAIVFLLLAWGLYSLLSVAVPGLLKFGTFIQIIISGLLFVAVWGVFGNAVFKDYFDVLEEREKKTLGSQQKALELKNQAKEIQASIEAELRASRLEGIQDRDSFIEEAKNQATNIKNEAKNEADNKFKSAALELEKLRGAAIADASSEAQKLSQLVKERALSFEQKVIH